MRVGESVGRIKTEEVEVHFNDLFALKLSNQWLMMAGIRGCVLGRYIQDQVESLSLWM
jgi:hypothetical protein